MGSMCQVLTAWKYVPDNCSTLVLFVRAQSVYRVHVAQEALADKELYKKKEEIAHQHEYLMNNGGTEKPNPKGTA